MHDSFITSPRLPVSLSSPLPPDMSAASILSVTPPTLVHAKPDAAPTSSSSEVAPSLNLGGPKNSSTSAFVTLYDCGFCFCSTILSAILRMTVAISRSRFLTPLSRV